MGCYSSDSSQTEAGRWGGLCHGPGPAPTEDSSLDGVARMRRHHDLRTTVPNKETLLSLASLIVSQPDSKGRAHDDLQTSVSGCEGGHRGKTSTSGPDSSKGTRCRVNGRGNTRQSHRSHGPRCGGGLS
jgi:hypothetical protein